MGLGYRVRGADDLTFHPVCGSQSLTTIVSSSSLLVYAIFLSIILIRLQTELVSKVVPVYKLSETTRELEGPAILLFSNLYPPQISAPGLVAVRPHNLPSMVALSSVRGGLRASSFCQHKTWLLN